MARKTRPTRDPRTGRFVSKKRKPRSRRNPGTSRSDRYGSPHDTLERIESDLVSALDSLDMWHKPGDGSSLDSAVKALWRARNAVGKAAEEHDPYPYK